MRKRETPAGVASRAGAGEARCENVPNHSKNRAETPEDGARWSIHRLDTFEARIMAAVDCPWFAGWFKGMVRGKTACIHCGSKCLDTGLVAATQMDDDQLVTITACRTCCARSASFEAAAHAAIDAAEAGVLTSGRSFKHSVAGPEVVQ